MSLPSESALPAPGGPEPEPSAQRWDVQPTSGSASGIFAPQSGHALADFVEEIAPQAKRFAMSLTKRWCEAEELVQEAFFRLARNDANEAEIPGSQESAKRIRSRKAYLFATIRNLAIDGIRKSNRHQVENRDLEALPLKHKKDDNEIRLQQMETAVGTVIDQMQRNWADALRLKINGELTYSEIAEILKATTDQVRGWIFRGRKQLAAELRRQGFLEA